MVLVQCVGYLYSITNETVITVISVLFAIFYNSYFIFMFNSSTI